jgi:CRP/FNR family transcriptional regulator
MLTEALDENQAILQLAARSRRTETEGPDSLEERLSRAPLRTVGTKKHVFTEGDHRSHLYRVESGTICLYKILPDGRRQILGFAYPGDLLGIGPSGPHRHNAQATRPSGLRCLPWRSVERAARLNPAFAMTVWELIAQELAGAHELLLTVGQRVATERVAAFLLGMARRNEREGEDPAVIVLSMTRADIGDLLALTIETVSRVFTRLRRAKVIDVAQSSHVHIRDIEALERLARGGKEL